MDNNNSARRPPLKASELNLSSEELIAVMQRVKTGNLTIDAALDEVLTVDSTRPHPQSTPAAAATSAAITVPAATAASAATTAATAANPRPNSPPPPAATAIGSPVLPAGCLLQTAWMGFGFFLTFQSAHLPSPRYSPDNTATAVHTSSAAAAQHQARAAARSSPAFTRGIFSR